MFMLDSIIRLDEWLFFFINDLYHSVFLDWIFLFFSFYPLIIWVLIGLVVTFVEERKDHWFFVKLLTALIFAGLLTSVLIKPLVRRPRPDISHGIKVVLVDEHPAAIPFNNDFAFPSGHAAVAFAGAYILTREETRKKHLKNNHNKNYKKIASWVFYLVAAITAFSRIYLGKHYPLDIIFGGLLGLFVGAVSWNLVERLREK